MADAMTDEQLALHIDAIERRLHAIRLAHPASLHAVTALQHLEALNSRTAALLADLDAARVRELEAELAGIRPPKPEVTGNVIAVSWQPGYWRVTRRAEPFVWDDGEDDAALRRGER